MNKIPMYGESGRATVAARRGRRGLEVKRRRKTVDADLIMSLGPCPAWPEKRVREAVPKRVSLTDFLQNKAIPAADRVWVALRSVFLTDRVMRLFACDCAERALTRKREMGREPDPRSWAAVAVARRYAVGEATDEELAAARDAAWSAARDAAGDAAGAAAGDAAWDAAWSAAWDAAEVAAWDAAGAAAGDAAWDAEQKWQCARLVEMLTREEA